MEACESKSKFKKLTEVVEHVKLHDLIEIQRPSGKCGMHPYCHWALYNGDDEVVHFRPVNALKISGTSCHCASNESEEEEEEPKGGHVLLQNIKDVVGDHNCRINNLRTEAAKRGVLELDTFKIEENIRIALKTKFYDYHFRKKNCEYFVTSLKYTEGFSDQVRIKRVCTKAVKYVKKKCDVI